MAYSIKDPDAAFNVTKTIRPLPGQPDRYIYVLAESTGSVAMYAIGTKPDGSEFENLLETFEAGEGDLLSLGTHSVKFVPSDDTTYYKI